ncbi:MAG: cytochrome C [Phycisphaerae bacterium]|nr:cytochrome C [Phycisphaerae bacterium]
MNSLKLTVATLVLAGLTSGAGAQITNSAHDFSSYSWSGGEICKPCHTPHFANTAAGRLWNHTLSTATYTMFDGATGDSSDLDRESRLCLSCHDGTVALDSFGGMTGTNFIPGGANIGTDLTNDHPIGRDAVYPTTTSTRFNPQNASHQVVSTWGTLRLKSWTNSAGAEQFVVGCRTCHNVHNAGNFNHMLNFSNASSHLCLTCHIK